MMKVVQINTTCGIGSTGKICVGISKLLDENGIENHILYSSWSNDHPNGIPCSNQWYIRWQALKSRMLGNYGFNSKTATQKMIAELERISPDVVHLHNIHGHDCDLELLFSYFKEHGTKLVWTFHDCWAFTGYCTHFTMANCSKWQTRCGECPLKHERTWFFDRSQALFEKKKQLFDKLDLTIVTPSRWMADLVKQSFLKDCPIEVIHNGIDLEQFAPAESQFRQKFGLVNHKIILGVAFGWGRKKGLDVFVDLAEKLSDEYRIVLVGTDKSVDRRLPPRILSVHRTQNQQELAQIYSAADLFVNPTREENYPTVNMEAIACGTPVLTFRTGGSPEMLDDTCGSVVACNDVEALEKEIIRICTDKPYPKDACTKKAQAFDQNVRLKEYLKLYERINAAGDQRS